MILPHMEYFRAKRDHKTTTMYCLNCDQLIPKVDQVAPPRGTKPLCAVCLGKPETAVKLPDGPVLLPIPEAINQGWIVVKCFDKKCVKAGDHRSDCHHFDCYDSPDCARKWCEDHCPKHNCRKCCGSSHSPFYEDGVYDGLYGEGADL